MTGRRGRPPHRGERGAVTAELAVALPLLLALTVGLVWLLSVGAAQVRAVDAARETARALARGDDPAAAVAAGQRVAPAGARVTVSTAGADVVASVSAEVDGPGGLFSALSSVTVRAEAVALVEEPP